jgi:hypothetical protein
LNSKRNRSTMRHEDFIGYSIEELVGYKEKPSGAGGDSKIRTENRKLKTQLNKNLIQKNELVSALKNCIMEVCLILTEDQERYLHQQIRKA